MLVHFVRAVASLQKDNTTRGVFCAVIILGNVASLWRAFYKLRQSKLKRENKYCEHEQKKNQNVQLPGTIVMFS